MSKGKGYMRRVIAALRGRNPDDPSDRSRSPGNYSQRIEINKGGATNTITSVAKDNYVIEYEEYRNSSTGRSR